MARNPKQNLHGVILLDKPTGMSSNRALQKVKHCLGAKKAGHTGSLDPLATGLLPICLGQATKVSEYLLGSSKRYETVIKLGQTTDTLDAEGEVLISRSVCFSDDHLEQALEQFRGQIKQVPPMYSALKKDGQPLYKLARKGESIERKPRAMTVHELTAERVDHEHLRLSVHCSSGFYIRSLADDLGEVLGCGAHVIELRRTAIKSLSVNHSITLEELLESPDPRKAIQPIDSLLQDFPRLTLTEEQFWHLSHGRRPLVDRPESEQLTRFYAPDDTLFGVGCVTSESTLKCEKRFVLEE